VPIVHVRALERLDPAAIEGMLSSMAVEVSRACNCPVEDVWCTFAPVTQMTIGEELRDKADSIAYVDVMMRPRDDTTTARALEAAAKTAARHLEIPIEDAWVRLAPLHSGGIFAGGELLRW